MSAKKIHRHTLQRQVILEELQKLKTHPTAAMLHALVQKRLPKISLGTVYRNLEFLSRKGMVQKLALGGGESRFDGTVAPHQHVRCMECGRVDDLDGPPLVLTGVEHQDLGGYRILGHRLEFFGICPECQQSSAESNKGPNLSA